MLWCFCIFALLWCVCLFDLMWCCFLLSLCCGAFVFSLRCSVLSARCAVVILCFRSTVMFWYFRYDVVLLSVRCDVVLWSLEANVALQQRLRAHAAAVLRVVLAWKRSVCVLCSSAVDEPSSSADVKPSFAFLLKPAGLCQCLCEVARLVLVQCSVSRAQNLEPFLGRQVFARVQSFVQILIGGAHCWPPGDCTMIDLPDGE